MSNHCKKIVSIPTVPKANGGQEQGNIKAKGQANRIEGIMIKGNGGQLQRGLY